MKERLKRKGVPRKENCVCTKRVIGARLLLHVSVVRVIGACDSLAIVFVVAFFLAKLLQHRLLHIKHPFQQ